MKSCTPPFCLSKDLAAMKEPSLLLPMHPVIGGVEVQDQLPRRLPIWILNGAWGRTRAMKTFLGVEIGGTKLQLVLGDGQIRMAEHRRFAVEPSQGADGIRRNIEQTVQELGKGRSFDAVGVLRDVSRDVALSVARHVASCLASCRAEIRRHCVCHGPAIVRILRETSRRMSCRTLRGCCATVSRDTAESSASYWRVVKTL